MTHTATTARHVERILRKTSGEVSRHQKRSERDYVLISWQRCLKEYGIDPGRYPDIPILESHAVRTYEDELDELVPIAAEEMQHLHRSMQGSGYATILTSRDGIILRTICDPTLEKDFVSSNLRIGGNWSEENAGTNGIGTCILENRPVTVHRDQHFLVCNTNLSCTAAPVHNPLGEVVAILDTSCVSGENTLASQMLVRGLVGSAVRSIENQLIKLTAGRKKVVRFHSHMEFLGSPHEALISLNDEDRVVAANEIAAMLLGKQSVAACIGHPLSEYFSFNSNTPVSDGLLQYGYIVPLSLRTGHKCQVYATMCELPGRKLLGEGGHDVKKSLGLCAVAGKDKCMQHVVKMSMRLMDRNVSLLLHGETGTGKDVFARAIHDASSRAAKPFIAINCASIPESLIESELYGYRGGAFTGAKRDGMKGKIEQSDGGTLFLDEIGDMPLVLQTRLLRCVEEGAIVPLGGDKPIKVDLHIISATHRDLPTMIEDGGFREDLYYRLNGMKLDLVALRDREDLQNVIQEMLFLEEGSESQFEAAALSAMLRHDWPGNFRELRNVIRTGIAMSDGGEITLVDLPYNIASLVDTELFDVTLDETLQQAAQSERFQPESAEVKTPADLLADAEKNALMQALTDNAWNITNTAKSLNMSRNTLYRKVKRHSIPIERS